VLDDFNEEIFDSDEVTHRPREAGESRPVWFFLVFRLGVNEK